MVLSSPKMKGNEMRKSTNGLKWISHTRNDASHTLIYREGRYGDRGQYFIHKHKYYTGVFWEIVRGIQDSCDSWCRVGTIRSFHDAVALAENDYANLTPEQRQEALQK
jgi:hypothetical protein